MRRKNRFSLSIAVSTVLMVCLAILFAGSVGSAIADESQIISSGSDSDYKPITLPWTSERMENAKYYPLPKVEGSPPPIGTLEPEETVGESGMIPGGSSESTYSLEDLLAGIQTGTLGYPYPPPYTRYENFNGENSPWPEYKAYPYVTVGVLFFTQNGLDYRCSASSIGNYAIWTAGHCVSDGAENWSTNFLFLPAYKDGNPAHTIAQWTGSTAWVTSAWHINADLGKDMGGVVLNTNSVGWKVSQIGWLGFAWNQDRDQHWHQIGYPSASPFDGNRMIICASSHSWDDSSFDPWTVATGCDMTGGSSGGPWIMDFSGTSGPSNYLNGNVSYHYVGFGEEMYSPYFDDLAKLLWDALVGDTP